MAVLGLNQEFSNIIEGHKRIIFKVCNSYCNNPEDREDLAQEIIDRAALVGSREGASAVSPSEEARFGCSAHRV